MPTARTSESHPLRITAMTLGDGRGRIGFSQCPGRIDRYAISGPWKRDLDTDLDAIQRWGATAALYGLNAIPDHWRERVAWKDRLLAAARRLLSEPVVSKNTNALPSP